MGPDPFVQDYFVKITFSKSDDPKTDIPVENYI